MQDFRPPFLLRGAHVQSVLASSGIRRAAVLRNASAMLAASSDEVVDCGGGVQLLLHHAPSPIPGTARMALLIHGWEGSGQSTYMLAAANRLWQSGYRVLRLNLRDHGDSHHLNRELFHSCRLDDAIGALRWAQDKFPGERTMLGGYSLGGNFALRIAALAGSAGLRIDRVAAVCPVLDPAETMHALDGGWIGYRLYFMRKWRRSLERKREVFPELYKFGDLGRFRTLESMTDFFVREYTEYPDLMTYLRGYALTGDRLSSLEVPASMLMAADDPVIPVGDLARIAKPASLHIETARFGGHCGFLGSYSLESQLDDYLVKKFDGDAQHRSRAA